MVAGAELAAKEGIVAEDVQQRMRNEQGYWQKDEDGNWFLCHPGIEVPTVEPLW